MCQYYHFLRPSLRYRKTKTQYLPRILTILLISDLANVTPTNSVLRTNLDYIKLIKSPNTTNFLFLNLTYKKAGNVRIPPQYLFLN